MAEPQTEMTDAAPERSDGTAPVAEPQTEMTGAAPERSDGTAPVAEPQTEMTDAAPERSDGTAPRDDSRDVASVAVVGSVNLDLVVSVPHLPSPGETILGSDLLYRAGGKGGNQAVAAHRLGARTTLIAMTGDDQLGRDLRNALALEGIDLSYVGSAPGTPTGVAMIVVDDGGENTIVVAPGANLRLDADTVSEVDDVLRDADVLVLQGEVAARASREAAVRARSGGTTVIFNAAPLPQLPDPELDKLLGATDVLVVNEGEASQLLSIDPPVAIPDWAEAATRLCELGPSSAVITLGAAGSVASAGGRTFIQPAYTVEVLDTTGAGDSFTGALAVAIAEGHEMDDALRRANAAGALATTQVGAQSALPTRDRIAALVASQGGVSDA